MAGNIQTRRARERLKFLGCPYLEGLEDCVIHELLLSEGEARLRLLKWLLGKFHPDFQVQLSSLLTLRSDVGIIARLTEFFSILGVCSANDYDLVKGSTSLSRQAKFLDALTEVVYCSSLFSNDHAHLQTSFENCCTFPDSLCARDDVSSVFKTDVLLIPPVVAHVASIDPESLGNKKVPLISKLKTQLDDVRKSIGEQQSQFDKLMESHEYCQVDSQVLSDCCSAIQVSLSTLVQLMEDFRQGYHNEIEPWTKRDMPTLGCLGPSSKRVHSLLTLVNELLDSSLKLEEICHRWKKLRSNEFHHKDSFEEHICKAFKELPDQQTSSK